MMKKPYPSSKRHVLIKLEMARSGQGWRRLKIRLTLLPAKIRSRDSSRLTFGVTESRTPIISTNRSLMSIPIWPQRARSQDRGRDQMSLLLPLFAHWWPSPPPFPSLPSTRFILVLSLLPLLLLFFLSISSLFFSSFFTHVLDRKSVV